MISLIVLSSPGSVILQLEVGAAEAEAKSLLETAKIVLKNESLGLDPDYFYIQDPQGKDFQNVDPRKCRLLFAFSDEML